MTERERCARILEEMVADRALDRDAQVDAARDALAITAGAVSSLDEDRILRSFIGVINATLRTSYLPEEGARAAAQATTSASSSTRRMVPDLPKPRPYREIFVYSPVRRRRAPALRPGRARRPALVRPPRGFPHRSAGPGQGADGEEHRHRAGRLQGRLLRQAAAGRRRPRRRAGRGHRLLQALHQRPARHHRQPASTARSCRRRTSCATTTTIRTWWSPPTRARRPSPTSPTASPPSTASGSATRSRPAVRSVTTTRAWASPPRARWESVKRHFRALGRDSPDAGLHLRRHRRHVRRRVRQRHAAVASTSACWPRSTTATSSSTRTRMSARPSSSAQRLFELPRSSWEDYDKALICDGRRHLSAQRQDRSRCRRRSRPRSASRPTSSR